MKVLDLGDRTLAPGFFDIHVHGFGGQLAGESQEALSNTSVRLAQHGTTSFLPTLGGVADFDQPLEQLETRVKEQTQALTGALALVTQSREEALSMIGLTLEYRDYETKGHTERTTRLALALGRKLGLDDQRLTVLNWDAYLHDIGKIAMSDSILLKPQRLTPTEFEHVKNHVVLGEEMLSQVHFLPDAGLMIVRHHHERWDGSGYPDGLVGKDIPYLARIFSVVDVYDALLSQRPYKAAWSREAAVRELLAQRGQQFDAQIVEAFLTFDLKQQDEQFVQTTMATSATLR